MSQTLAPVEIADPGGRELLIACGAALFTARLALRSPRAALARLDPRGEPAARRQGPDARGTARPEHTSPDFPAGSSACRLSDGAHPHLILRFGNVVQVAVSTRREVADVLAFPDDLDDS